MLTVAQQDLLASFIGSDGIYLYEIKEYSGLDLGTKIIYLERATANNQDVFFQSLDLIYNPDLDEEEKRANLEFIRALKVVNDLCFNNPVRYAEFGTRSALDHYFSSLGEVNPEEFQSTTQQIIREQINTLCADHTDEVIAQKQARVLLESTLSRQNEWREKLFPEDQPQELFQIEARMILLFLQNREEFLHTNEAFLVNLQTLSQQIIELNNNLREIQEIKQRMGNLKRSFDNQMFGMQVLGGFISALGSLAVATGLIILTTGSAFNVTFALIILGDLGLFLGSLLFTSATKFLYLKSQEERSILDEAQKLSVERTYICMQVLEGFFAVLGTAALILAFVATSPVMISTAGIVASCSIVAEIGFFTGSKVVKHVLDKREPTDHHSLQTVADLTLNSRTPS